MTEVINVMILHLPLKAKWYDMQESGEKTEEYREYTEYWHKRLIDQETLRPKPYTHVCFHYGYTKRCFIHKIDSITVGMGLPEWGAPAYREVFIIKHHKEVSPIINGDHKRSFLSEYIKACAEIDSRPKNHYHTCKKGKEYECFCRNIACARAYPFMSIEAIDPLFGTYDRIIVNEHGNDELYSSFMKRHPNFEDDVENALTIEPTAIYEYH